MAANSIVVEFEVLPDDIGGPGERSPQQVCRELQRQLGDPGSQLRLGDFGRFAAAASLSSPGLTGLDAGGGSEKNSEFGTRMEEVGPPPPLGSFADPQVFHSVSAGSGQGFGQESVVHQPSGADPSSGARKSYGSGNDWQGLSNADLVDRIAQLEGQLQRTAAGGRQEGALPPSSSMLRQYSTGMGGGQVAEDKYSYLQQRLEAVERELREANEAARMWRQRHEQCEVKLKDREQLLVHAKEMWMKENVRASKLADALTQAEDKLADQEKRLSEVAERYNEAQREVRSLHHLVGDSEGGAGGGGGGGGFGGDPFGTSKNGHIAGTAASLQSSPQRPMAPASAMELSPGTSRDLRSFGGAKAMPSSSPGLMMDDMGRPLPSMPLDADTNADRFRRLCLMNDAILYEDEILQVGIKAEYVGREGQIAVFFGNKGTASLHAFTAQYFVKEEQALRLSASPLSQQLDGDKQVVQRVSVTMQEPFAEPPWLRIQFLLPDTSPRRIQLKFPIMLTKFFVGREMTSGEFFQIWRRQEFVLSEATSIVHLAARFRGALVHVARSIVFGGSLRMQPGIDTNPDNFVLVGQLADASSRPGGGDQLDFNRSLGGDASSTERGLLLARVEIGSGRFVGKARIVVRSSDHTCARSLCDSIVAQLSEPNAPQSDGVVAR